MSQVTQTAPVSHPLQDRSPQALPYRTPEQETLLMLLRTADLAKHRFSALFEGEGITFQQYNVLRILRGAAQPGLPTLEVGERMIERTPGVTRIIDRLEAKGLVRRERCSEDRRKVWCRLTEEGMELLSRLDRPVSQTDVGIFDGMPRDNVTILRQTLEQLHASLSSLE
jgi:DNA-binding MarR family transcriptional regulator